jgi:sulfatase maturation enzyme AslB (radical SAM superfamily)
MLPSFKVHYDIYFMTTRNCNLECDHCFVSAKPNNKDTTMSVDNFYKAVGNLPGEDPIRLKLTGGEIFTIPNHLWGYLDVISGNNTTRKKDNQIDVSLQTNGFWATSIKAVEEVKKRLDKQNFRWRFDVPSNDKYHNGVLTEDMSYWLKEHLGVYPRGSGGRLGLMPLGRAQTELCLSPSEIFVSSEQCSDLSHYTIDETGTVYSCCYKSFPLPGNIINDPLEKIVEMAKEDKTLRTLFDNGPEEVAILEGVHPGEARCWVAENGECGMCINFLGENNPEYQVRSKITSS